MKQNQFDITFKLAEQNQREQIIQWLTQEHISEWLHGVGLKNLLDELDAFFKGNSDSQHWIAYTQEIPFAYLLIFPKDDDAITVDLFIFDLNYLGKGLAVPMIQTFLTTQFPTMKRIFIDPEASNIRAIHVYKKVGFKIVGEFIASWHPVPHYQMELDMKDLLDGAKAD